MNIKSTRRAQLPHISQGKQLSSMWAEDPMKVLVMLFDKSLVHISQARASLTGWSNDRYQTHILRAVDVIEHLQLTLDMESNKPMASNFNDIYRYVARILIDSIHDQDPSHLNQASHLLLQIRESLSVLVKKPPTMLQH